MADNYANHGGRMCAVIGASGAIGGAFIRLFAADPAVARIYAFSRVPLSISDTEQVLSDTIDIEDEASIQAAAQVVLEADCRLDMVIVATGVLHRAHFQPEKSLNALSKEAFQAAFATNTIGPALVAKHFVPCLRRDKRTVFAVLSARVGSISDNQLGGWYAYRASKAALNMVIKTVSIEVKRSLKQAIIVGLHPGTVASALSAPFQSRVPPDQLFTPDVAVSKLWQTISGLTVDDSGKLIAFDGEEIAF